VEVLLFVESNGIKYWANYLTDGSVRDCPNSGFVK